jgi:CDP-glucose 4,6-dehydratase
VAIRQRTVEGVGLNRAFWRDRRVLVTGHTGFKGGWLALWLQALGAKVSGWSLPPPTLPSLFEAGRVADGMDSRLVDLRDRKQVNVAARAADPEIVLHLAAQSLVKHSYADPVDTYATNVMGTVHLLDALRGLPRVRAVVVVSSDKCYENREWPWGYRENEAMGGFDPYSSSKGCVELVTAAYRDSYFKASERPAPGAAIATARAGNVVGGGDWARDRLIPDCFRAIDAKAPIRIRRPDAVRPWQHVLDPLAGYLALAERLHGEGNDFAEAWNFGPSDEDTRPVRWVVERLIHALGGGATWEADTAPQPHEANALKLDCSKARLRLNWRPRWPLRTAVEKVCAWRQAYTVGANMRDYTLAQIAEFEAGES